MKAKRSLLGTVGAVKYPDDDGHGIPVVTKADTTSRPRLGTRDAVEYLRARYGIDVAEATLKTWAWRGGGPGFQKSGPRRLYPTEELDAWAQQRLTPIVASTSELATLSTGRR
jgi:hypothetical protein